jgi:hypothetical protein
LKCGEIPYEVVEHNEQKGYGDKFFQG